MKDQRTLESIKVYLPHEARCHTPKSSREASCYPVTATLCSPAISHLNCQRTNRQIGRQTWSERERGGGVKPNKEKESFTFKQIDSLSDYRQEGGDDELQARSSDKRQH